MEIRPAIICDLDGTLSIHCDRDMFDFDKSIDDLVNKPIADIVRLHQKDFPVIIVTSRDEKWRQVTELWLEKNSIPYDRLLMRYLGDPRQDHLLKYDIYMSFIKHKYEILFVLEDTPSVVAMWREQGLTTLQVADGSY